MEFSRLARSSSVLLVVGALLLGSLAHVLGGLLGLAVGAAAIGVALVVTRRLAPNLTAGKSVVTVGALVAAFGAIECLATGGPRWYLIACGVLTAYFTWRLFTPRR